MKLFGLLLLLLVDGRQIKSPFLYAYEASSLTVLKTWLKPEWLSVSGKDSLLEPLLIQRVSGTPGNTQVQEFLAAFFLRLGWHVERDSFEADTIIGPKKFTNIIATLHPKAPRKLLLSAHFDSKDLPSFIGATDSAAPCAILLAIAQSLDATLKKHSQILSTGTTLQMVFFDGEEAFRDWTATDSIYGSRHLAEKWEKELVPLIPVQNRETKEEGQVKQTEDSGADDSQQRVKLLEHIEARQQAANSGYVSVLQTIELFVLLDLLGAPNCHVFNYFSENYLSNYAYRRLVDIQNRLHSQDLLSPTLKVRMAQDKGFFTNRQSFFASQKIEDDHIPFMNRNVSILHAISLPFPAVWHKESDNAAALEQDSMYDLALIFTVFVGEYLGLGLL